jgi:hypothetical protein
MGQRVIGSPPGHSLGVSAGGDPVVLEVGPVDSVSKTYNRHDLEKSVRKAFFGNFGDDLSEHDGAEFAIEGFVFCFVVEFEVVDVADELLGGSWEGLVVGGLES